MEKTYKSNYTEQPITSAQFLTEFICERIAQKEKKVLKYKFWQDDEWKKTFQRQIVAANQLLKEFDCIQIMSFLRSPKGKWILSLGLKKPILSGCKPRSTNEHVPIDDGFMSDFTEQENSEVESTNSKSLWRKLNGQT